MRAAINEERRQVFINSAEPPRLERAKFQSIFACHGARGRQIYGKLPAKDDSMQRTLS